MTNKHNKQAKANNKILTEQDKLEYIHKHIKQLCHRENVFIRLSDKLANNLRGKSVPALVEITLEDGTKHKALEIYTDYEYTKSINTNSEYKEKMEYIAKTSIDMLEITLNEALQAGINAIAINPKQPMSYLVNIDEFMKIGGLRISDKERTEISYYDIYNFKNPFDISRETMELFSNLTFLEDIEVVSSSLKNLNINELIHYNHFLRDYKEMAIEMNTSGLLNHLNEIDNLIYLNILNNLDNLNNFYILKYKDGKAYSRDGENEIIIVYTLFYSNSCEYKFEPMQSLIELEKLLETNNIKNIGVTNGPGEVAQITLETIKKYNTNRSV